MKKRENRVVKSLIAGVLCLSQLQIPVNVLAAEGEPENLALNKTTSASALEVSDGHSRMKWPWTVTAREIPAGPAAR